MQDLPDATTHAALVALGRWIVLLMIDTMLIVMALCGSHHFQAAAMAKCEEEKTGRHLEKVEHPISGHDCWRKPLSLKGLVSD